MRFSSRTVWGIVFISLILNVFLGGMVVSRFLPHIFSPPPRSFFSDAVSDAAAQFPEPLRSRITASWQMHSAKMHAEFASAHLTTQKIFAELASRDTTASEVDGLIEREASALGGIGLSVVTGISIATKQLNPDERRAFFVVMQNHLAKLPPPPHRP